MIGDLIRMHVYQSAFFYEFAAACPKFFTEFASFPFHLHIYCILQIQLNWKDCNITGGFRICNRQINVSTI